MLDFKSTLLYIIIAYMAVWACKIVHSIFFSQLRNVPGPFIVHFFPTYIRKSALLKGTIHHDFLALHKKYGTVVRIGGEMVSFATEEASNEIYSTYNYDKAETYTSFQIVGETVFSTRKREFHNQRKRIIAPSFSERSVLEIEHLVKQNINVLANKIDKLALEASYFDLGRYFNFLAFDVIGDVAYGRSFEMLNSGYHPVIGWLKDVFFFASIITAFPIMRYYQPASIKKLYEFSLAAIKSSKSHSRHTTILNNLISAEDPDTGLKLSEKEIAEESIIQLLAGTDTTSNSLTWIFYNLVKHPDLHEKIKTELHLVFPDKDSINYTTCKSDCPYLSALIYESLRMYPPAAGFPSRKVPKGGKVIDGYFIPEGTTVGINIMSHHNLPLLWDSPDEFKPERWIDKDGEFKNNKNFMPFLIGPTACLGRTLAWMEIYLVAATLIRNFSFKLRDPKQNIESKCFFVTTPKTPVEVIAVNNGL